jgi:hypothetical protein
MNDISRVIQEDFINKIDEIFRSTNDLSSRDYSRKIKDLRLFVILIDPDTVENERRSALNKIISRINRNTSFVFTRQDITILNSFTILPITTRHRLLDEEILTFRQPRGSSREFFSRPASSFIANDVRPGIWDRSSTLTYRTDGPEQTTPANVIVEPTSSIPSLPSIIQITQPIVQQPIKFEEDNTFYNYIKADKNSLMLDKNDREKMECDKSNDDPDSSNLTDTNRQWFESNCYTCLDPITQYNYTNTDFNDIVSIKQIDSTGKFKRGHCISVEAFKKGIKSDFAKSANQFDPKIIFTIYKLKNPNLPDDDLKRGLGTRPTKDLVFQLNLPSGSLFIDMESAYKLLRNWDKELYALPLFGGLRRRIGNLKGSLMEISAHHGQIEGYKIYRLLTRQEIEMERSVDFELQVLTEMQYLLNSIYKQDQYDYNNIINITNSIIKILIGDYVFE